VPKLALFSAYFHESSIPIISDKQLCLSRQTKTTMNLLTKLTFLLFVFSQHSLFAQEWELEKTVNGVEIYTRLLDGAEIKELKMNFICPSDLGPLISLISDAERFTQWVYRATEFKAISSSSPGEGIFYGSVDFPWPLDDRDYVIKTTLTQNPDTKAVLIRSEDIEVAELPEVDGFIRLPGHQNEWRLQPLGNGQTQVEYWLYSQPGGSIPDWMVNLAIDKGAVETIKNLLEEVQSYKCNPKLAYILEK